MAAVTFNVSPLEFDLDEGSTYTNVGTSGDEGFVQSDNVYERAIRTVTLTWNAAIEGVRWSLDRLWDLTGGGADALNFTSPTTGETYEVEFDAEELTDETLRIDAHRMRVTFTEVL